MSDDAPVIPVGSEAARIVAFLRQRAPTGHSAVADLIEREFCQGAGQERVIPATDLRAWIADHRPLRFKSDLANTGYLKALDDLSAWLDEYTAEAPSGGTT